MRAGERSRFRSGTGTRQALGAIRELGSLASGWSRRTVGAELGGYQSSRWLGCSLVDAEPQQNMCIYSGLAYVDAIVYISQLWRQVGEPQGAFARSDMLMYYGPRNLAII